MDWIARLEPGEIICWEGRPAPRCYTFRNWRHSLFGLFLLIITVYWQIVALELAMAYELVFIAWIPAPVLLIALYLSLGHLIRARLEWERVFYALTDRRVLVRRGLRRPQLHTLPLDRVRYFKLTFHAEQLGTLRVHADHGVSPLVLHCIEHPRRVTELLEKAVTSTR